MKNNTNYFSHDCNARDDEKVMMLRAKYGREGYWIRRLIVEKLSEATDYRLLVTNKLVISNLYNADLDCINYLFELWLLKESWKYFSSPSLLKRMEKKNNIKWKQSEWWKEAMRKRWWDADTYKSLISPPNKWLITSKVKESKVKEKKEKKEEEKKEAKKSTNKVGVKGFETKFNEFWELYPEKKGRGKAVERYKKALKGGAEHSEIMAGVRLYIAEAKLKQKLDVFCPEPKHPSTRLYQQCRKDEYKTTHKQIFPKEEKRVAPKKEETNFLENLLD